MYCHIQTIKGSFLHFFSHPAGFLSAQIKYVLKKITKQPLVFCLNQFSNINNFASNKDILKIEKLTESPKCDTASRVAAIMKTRAALISLPANPLYIESLYATVWLQAK